MCPDKDKFKCRSKTSDDCQLESRLWESCPILCGVCEPSPPPSFVSEFGCTYVGKRPTSAKCRKMGNRGLDSSICASEGGKSGCAECVTIGETCPVMCGLCDAPCRGKRCLNGGSLNPSACVCQCPSHYQGDICQDLSCPKKDFWKCGKEPYLESRCGSDPKTVSKCPYLCGLCPVRTR
ncbi:multiple epidermal growth factor-like domains protein 6 [Liolophura sinensis]|uniref:multiple epidermal growth factor-like domains protein 6 n=1 Tax=Liolophura sinensis TaxID=3198878 RepID=UPI0031584CC6